MGNYEFERRYSLAIRQIEHATGLDREAVKKVLLGDATTLQQVNAIDCTKMDGDDMVEAFVALCYRVRRFHAKSVESNSAK